MQNVQVIEFPELITNTVIDYYEIVLYERFDNKYGRIRFGHGCEYLEESQLYTVVELNEIIVNWRNKQLLWSFARGYELSKQASFQLMQE